MVVDYPDILVAVWRPAETSSPLPINAYRIMSRPVALQSLQMVAGRET